MDTHHLNLLRQDTSNGQVAIIRLDGKLNLETVNTFLQTVRPEGAPGLILDMSGVKFLDSAGLGALVQLFVHRRSRGQSFALAALTQQANAVMEVAGMLKLLPTYGSVNEAIHGKR